MERIRRRNLRLAAALAMTALLCGGLLSSYFLWELVDIRNRVYAQLTFFASMMMYLVGAFSLAAFVSVLRLGVLLERESIAAVFCALVQLVLRALLAFCNVGMLGLGFVGVIDAKGRLLEWMGVLFFLAAVVAGYVSLYRLEKRLKAQRNQPTAFN